MTIAAADKLIFAMVNPKMPGTADIDKTVATLPAIAVTHAFNSHIAKIITAYKIDRLQSNLG